MRTVLPGRLSFYLPGTGYRFTRLVNGACQGNGVQSHIAIAFSIAISIANGFMGSSEQSAIRLSRKLVHAKLTLYFLGS